MIHEVRCMCNQAIKIKAIIFDIGGVLVAQTWPSMIEYYATILSIDTKILEKVILERIEDYQRNRISENDLWTYVASKHPIPLSKTKKLWIKGIRASYHERSEMFFLVNQLKENGFLLGILANTEQTAVEDISNRFEKIFHVIVLSPEVGFRKPQKEIYKYILQKLDTLPHETLFVDDQKENIDGAKGVGMHAIHYTTHKKFMEEFSQFVELG